MKKVWVNNLLLSRLCEKFGVPSSSINPWINLNRADRLIPSLEYFSDRSQIIDPCQSTVTVDHLRLPNYNQYDKRSWADINDKRAKDIESMALHYNSSYFLWSGGIDSTNALVALLKNSSPDFLAHLKIVLSDESIWENPYFYHRHIEKTFEHIITTIEFDFDRHIQDSLIITGHLGDRIMMGDLFLLWIYMYDDGHHDDYRKIKDKILTFLNGLIKDIETASWLYHTIDNSINRLNLPIANLYDFFWWFDFNFTWSGMYYHLIGDLKNIEQKTVDQLFKNHISWFDNLDFQSWSINNINSNQKYYPDGKLIKKSAKDYIFEFDKNKWYYHYKSKIYSAMRKNSIAGKPIHNLLSIDLDNTLQFFEIDKITNSGDVLEIIQSLTQDFRT